MNHAWSQLAERVYQARLPFCDVTIGLVHGSCGALVIDCGTTLSEACGIAADVQELTRCPVTQVVVTHDHFDHVLGSSAFSGAIVYAAPGVGTGTDALRDDAVTHGADPVAVEQAIAGLRPPDRQILEAVIDLGDLRVQVSHLGPGHTDHDLIVVVPPTRPNGRTVVFCGDLVEESGDPVVGADSDLASWPRTLERLLAVGGPEAIYVPGHGAPVGARFVGDQRDRLASLP